MRQIRQARQASNLYLKMDPVRHSLSWVNTGQCGRDSAHGSLHTVRAVATMDCLSSLPLDETSEASLLCAATLHRYNMSHDYAKLENLLLPETCSCCNAPLWDPSLSASREDRIFLWQSHLGRCGGDGRRHQAHDALKLAIKRLVLSSIEPVGLAFPKESVLD
jgi:hypothetical protein